MLQTGHQNRDNLTVAIGAILTSVLVLSFGDAVIKGMSGDLGLWQIYVLRSAIALPLVLLLIKLPDRDARLMPVSVVWSLLRSLMLVLMWVAYYLALPRVQLSQAAAVYYTIPLFVTLFSALFTGDRVSSKTWLAIIVGFVGVIIIVRPEGGEFNAYLLLPLLAAILYALAMILTRTRCRQENPRVLSLMLNLSFIATGLIAIALLAIVDPDPLQIARYPFLMVAWQSLEVTEWLAMSVLAMVVVAGSIFAALAYQRAPSPLVATFDYSYLAFSAFWGFVFFADLPDLFSFAGMSMIVIAGILVLWR